MPLTNKQIKAIPNIVHNLNNRLLELSVGGAKQPWTYLQFKNYLDLLKNDNSGQEYLEKLLNTGILFSDNQGRRIHSPSSYCLDRWFNERNTQTKSIYLMLINLFVSYGGWGEKPELPDILILYQKMMETYKSHGSLEGTHYAESLRTLLPIFIRHEKPPSKSLALFVGDKDGRNLAHHTCFADLECVKILYKAHPELFEHRDFQGRTPVFYSLESSKLEIARWLLEETEVSLDIVDSDGFKVINIIIEKGKIEHLNVYIKKGARLTTKVCPSLPDNLSMIHLLSDNGFFLDPDAVNSLVHRHEKYGLKYIKGQAYYFTLTQGDTRVEIASEEDLRNTNIEPSEAQIAQLGDAFSTLLKLKSKDEHPERLQKLSELFKVFCDKYSYQPADKFENLVPELACQRTFRDYLTKPAIYFSQFSSDTDVFDEQVSRSHLCQMKSLLSDEYYLQFDAQDMTTLIRELYPCFYNNNQIYSQKLQKKYDHGLCSFVFSCYSQLLHSLIYRFIMIASPQQLIETHEELIHFIVNSLSEINDGFKKTAEVILFLLDRVIKAYPPMNYMTDRLILIYSSLQAFYHLYYGSPDQVLDSLEVIQSKIKTFRDSRHSLMLTHIFSAIAELMLDDLNQRSEGQKSRVHALAISHGIMAILTSKYYPFVQDKQVATCKKIIDATLAANQAITFAMIKDKVYSEFDLMITAAQLEIKPKEGKSILREQLNKTQLSLIEPLKLINGSLVYDLSQTELESLTNNLTVIMDELNTLVPTSPQFTSKKQSIPPQEPCYKEPYPLSPLLFSSSSSSSPSRAKLKTVDEKLSLNLELTPLQNVLNKCESMSEELKNQLNLCDQVTLYPLYNNFIYSVSRRHLCWAVWEPSLLNKTVDERELTAFSRLLEEGGMFAEAGKDKSGLLTWSIYDQATKKDYNTYKLKLPSKNTRIVMIPKQFSYKSSTGTEILMVYYARLVTDHETLERKNQCLSINFETELKTFHQETGPSKKHSL